MGKINLGRVFLGGLGAAGFCIALQYIAFFLGAYDKLGKAAGLPLSDATPAAQLAVANLELWVGGPLAIWLYAAIRPRFGAGPRTAVRSAVYIWLIMMPYGFTVLAISRLLVPLPIVVMIVLNVMSLPLFVAAVLLGARMYSE